MVHSKKNEVVQLPLFSNLPFSASIPSRATSKQENDFIVVIRNEIQNFIKNGGDYSEPITLRISLKEVAKEWGVVKLSSLQRSFRRTLSSIKKYPLNQTIQYLDEEGTLRERTYWMLSYIDENPKEGVIEIVINKDFQQYYVNELLRHPEIQIDVKFHETCSSSYTYPFVNWLSAKIAEMQREGQPYPYHVSISFEEMQIRVPPLQTNRKNAKPMRPTEYRRNAIEKAIADINSNQYSQLRIENPDDFISKRKGRAISEFTFIVSLRERTPVNYVPLTVGTYRTGLIDDALIPDWDYLKQKMLDLGYGKSSIPQWESKKAKVWRALLLSWVQISKIRKEKGKMENPGGYLQTMLHSSRLGNDSYRHLAMNVVLNAPEYRDEVVDATAAYQSPVQAQVLAEIIDQNKKTEKQTPENNALLKEMLQKGMLKNISFAQDASKKHLAK